MPPLLEGTKLFDDLKPQIWNILSAGVKYTYNLKNILRTST